jgi:hypothetical protein
VDHDHKTGQVRDVICRLCNMALGSARDSERTLLNLAKYLRRSQERQLQGIMCPEPRRTGSMSGSL